MENNVYVIKWYGPFKTPEEEKEFEKTTRYDAQYSTIDFFKPNV